MKKILILLLAVILVAGIFGTAFAYFSDTETSTGNEFTAGILDLEITDSDPDIWGGGCSSTWMLPNIVPGFGDDGFDTVTNAVFLRRTGSIAGNHLEVQAFISLDEAINPIESDTDPSSSAEEMAKKIAITQMQYDGVTSLYYKFIDVDGDGVKSLYDLSCPPEVNGLNNLPQPPNNSTGTFFSITFQWVEGSNDNDFQGDSLVTNISFTLNQDASQ